MKTIIIFLSVLTGFITVNFDYLAYLKPNGNTVYLGSKSVVHQSENCKVESHTIKNSKFYNGSVYVITIYKNKMSFGVVSGSNYTDNHFYINSNFFGYNGKPLGETKVNDKKVSFKTKGGGFFTTNGGNGDISIYGRPNSKYISQTNYVAIRNGRINHSYDNAKWGKIQTHRIMIGENKNGDIVVIHTNASAQITIPIMNQIAIKSNVVNAIHLDGGTSVEVKLRDGFYNHSFDALPIIVKKASNVPIPPVHIVGNFKD